MYKYNVNKFYAFQWYNQEFYIHFMSFDHFAKRFLKFNEKEILLIYFTDWLISKLIIFSKECNNSGFIKSKPLIQDKNRKWKEKQEESVSRNFAWKKLH